jgi:hypothetical protein
VDITRQQAIDLLHRWQVERRLIQGGIFQSKKDRATSGFLGRIERLDSRSLTIDARSLFMLGDRCGLKLPLEADYSYSDSPDGPNGHGEPLREAYDSALFIVIAPGWQIELFATKPKSEITH